MDIPLLPSDEGLLVDVGVYFDVTVVGQFEIVPLWEGEGDSCQEESSGCLDVPSTVTTYLAVV